MSNRDSDYYGDVSYEVWRNGGNPDAVDYDRCAYARDNGIEAESHAHKLLREDDERRQQREFERQTSDEDRYYQELEMRDSERSQ